MSAFLLSESVVELNILKRCLSPPLAARFLEPLYYFVFFLRPPFHSQWCLHLIRNGRTRWLLDVPPQPFLPYAHQPSHFPFRCTHLDSGLETVGKNGETLLTGTGRFNVSLAIRT